MLPVSPSTNVRVRACIYDGGGGVGNYNRERIEGGSRGGRVKEESRGGE